MWMLARSLTQFLCISTVLDPSLACHSWVLGLSHTCYTWVLIFITHLLHESARLKQHLVERQWAIALGGFTVRVQAEWLLSAGEWDFGQSASAAAERGENFGLSGCRARLWMERQMNEQSLSAGHLSLAQQWESGMERNLNDRHAIRTIDPSSKRHVGGCPTALQRRVRGAVICVGNLLVNVKLCWHPLTYPASTWYHCSPAPPYPHTASDKELMGVYKATSRVPDTALWLGIPLT